MLALFKIRNVLSGAGDVHRLALVAYSIPLALVDFTTEADIYESASGPMVEICE